MDDFTEVLARPIRDRLNDLGYHAIIVMDEPTPRGAFTPEEKVNAYIDASDAFVALCTPDPRVPGGTAQNIIDEIGRARTHPRLREVVCILKEEGVKLPSNIDPVWERLDPADPLAAFEVIQRQLNSWGVMPTAEPATPSASRPLPADFLDDLFNGIGLGEHEKVERRLRAFFKVTTKVDQRRVTHGIYEYCITPSEADKALHVATSLLEAACRIDPALVEMSWIEKFAMSSVTELRMSAAMMLWDLSVTMPGVVPLDLVAKLAKPSGEDWYVFAPALGASKQLALIRKGGLDIILDLARSVEADDRDYAISALAEVARVDAALIPVEPVKRLAKDTDSSIAARASELLLILSKVTDGERNTRYGRFAL